MASSDFFQIAFLPWITFDKTRTFEQITFTPLFTEKREVTPILAPVGGDLTRILSGYLDQKGNPVRNCTIVCKSGAEPWHLPDAVQKEVKDAVSFLMLSCSASNSYFGSFGSYVNSTAFETFWQRFTPPADSLSIQRRRRDGTVLDMGYKHGQIKYTIPPQCANLRQVEVDDALLEAIKAALTSSPALVRRINNALTFFGQANTDSSTIAWETELVMLVFALEELIESRGKAHDFSKHIGELLKPYGNRTVDDARKLRPDIKLMVDSVTGKSAWVHRAWAEEIYVLRGMIAHGNDLTKIQLGWHVFEHNLIASYLFPLVVKILLEEVSVYQLTTDDRTRCLALDRLLGAVQWREMSEDAHTSEQTNWREIIRAAQWDVNFDQINKQLGNK